MSVVTELPTASRTVASHTEDASLDAAPTQTIIRPPSGFRLINAAELWRYRELLYFLTWRDVKVRYKQTLLGAAWAVLQPAMMMIVFTVFFGRLANVSSGGVPYPLFVYAGLLPWTFFATAISSAGNSVVGSERLITKIYFPRLTIPFASVGAALVDFAVAFSLMLVLMVWYQVVPTARLLLVPLLVAVLALAALGVGTLLAALNVAYRDFRYVIPFLVQLWMFATPTVYMDVEGQARDAIQATSTVALNKETTDGREASDHEPAAEASNGSLLKVLLGLNPITGIIASFRGAILGGTIPWLWLAGSAAASGAMFVVGCLYFRRVESSFADII